MSSTLNEHHGYLSDSVRIERYRQAIAQAIRPGDVVVDVGCGFAVLGLLCLEAGAARVYGIDRSEAIHIAREAAHRAGYGDRYVCLPGSSFRAVLPEPADVVICDHVGYFGFDYGVIATMSDARRRMMRPGGKVIPGRIELHVAGVASPACRALAEAWTIPAMPSPYHWLQDYAANTKHPCDLAAADLVTSEAMLGGFDLAEDVPAHASYRAVLVSEIDGALDGLGGWFDCQLVPGVTMTNSPLAPDRIARHQVFLPFDRPLDVARGDEIEISLVIRHEEEILGWTARNRRIGEQRRQSTWRSRILSEEDRSPSDDRIPQMSAIGQARALVASYVDGSRTVRAIEEAVIRDCPDLLPSANEIRAFVRAELARNTQ